MSVTALSDYAAEPSSTEALWQQRITDAENYRRRFEPIWLSNLAFVAGRQWDVYDRFDRTLRHISEVDPRYADRELYTADIIHENRGAAMGELTTDSDRPELLVPGNGDADQADEDIAQQVNRAVGHVWEHECDGDGAMEDARFKCLDLGVSAVRARFDPSAGKPRTTDAGNVEVPVGADGAPITDAAKAREYVAGQQEQGQTAAFRQVKEGRITWDVGSAFNILAPPGVPHEKNFPWEIWVEAVPLDEVKARYPAAKNLAPDSDIVSVLGLGMRQSVSQGEDSGPAKLRNYMWLYTAYERPCSTYPQGRKAVLGGSAKKLLEETPALDYEGVDGSWSSGIVYYHWWRLTDRFYSRSLIEALKDPQRLINRRQTQSNEIIDRGMPKAMIEEGSLVEEPSGAPMEILRLMKGTQVQPVFTQGIGPGPWMYQDKQELRNDASHASTLSALKLGENPENVSTYSQLAILNEQESGKRAAIRQQHQKATCRLVEFAVHDIQKYWPEEKQILVSGKENELQAQLFEKSKIPALFIVRAASGSAKPRGQGAQLQIVTDTWNAAVASLAVQADPAAWVGWYKASLEAGDSLELPTPPVDNQAEKAEIENHALMAGEQPAVAYWDAIQTHLPIHRGAEDHAILAGDVAALARIEHHIQEHKQVAAENQAAITAATPQPQMTPPGTPVPPGTIPAPLPPPDASAGGPSPSVSPSPQSAAPPSF